jgi:probable HAF family extracellular repeat protein
MDCCSCQDIKGRGQVVGNSFSPDAAQPFRILAFLWQNGVATNLGTLAPDIFSLAVGINNKGQVVGFSCDDSFSCRAFLWQDGTMTELNTLVHNPYAPFLENANSINSRGQIAGKTTVQETEIADAFVAIPSHGDATDETAATSQRQRFASPEIRRMLRQRLGPRYHIPGLGNSPRD